MTRETAAPSPPGRPKNPSRIARRGFVVGGVAVMLIGGVGAARWFNIAAQVTGADLSVTDAYEAAQMGDVTLVDIRRPDEWVATGIAKGAVPIDMRRDDFVDMLLRETQGDTSSPIALICARGVRSARMARLLEEAGFTNIVNVPEGMLGSGAGPGWLKLGLPIEAPKAVSN